MEKHSKTKVLRSPAPEGSGVRKFIPSILLADDNPTVRHFTATVLSGERYHVVCASDGVDALLLFDRLGRVDLLITDITMPRGSAVRTWRLLSGQKSRRY